MPATALDDIDVVVLDHAQLDAFVAVLGDPDDYELTILTDDSHTRGRVEFNLIVADDDQYGVGTQLADPLDPADTVLDCRREAPGGFADYLVGLA